MGIVLKELDYRQTELGELMLRMRQSPQLPGVDIYEVKLGEYFLMSSLFHEAESQLASLALAQLQTSDSSLEVVVGGLGLGYTAQSALKDDRVKTLRVIEYLKPVIEWHEQGLVPLGDELTTDPRCRLQHADFFGSAHSEAGFDPECPGKAFDAILLDIDHTPENLLDPGNANFYSEAGLTRMLPHLKSGGVFALWADGKPDDAFTERLQTVFGNALGHTIEFENPIAGGYSHGAVYTALKKNDSE